jgi:TP901 family phage tail tape measure protein
MGFAGQVFAARVAIGLAVPSPQAMQQAGGLLSTGAASIFQKIALMREQASAKNRGIALSEQQKSAGLFQSNLKQTNALMQGEVARGLKNLQDSGRAVAGSFADSEGKVKEGFAGLKKATADTQLGKDLFKGVNQGTEPLKRMTRLVSNLAQMDAKGRREVLRLQKEQEQAAKDEFLANAKLLKQIDEKISEEINNKRKGGEAQKQRLKALEKEREKMKGIVEEGEKRLKVEEKNTRNLKTGMKEAEKARGKFDKLADSAARFGANVASAGNHIRQGFNVALRNSVAIATAFYYKINQNTQALIEFERELLNANSVFNLTNTELFDVGDTITQFGQKFGMEMQNGATGLYQLASAGVSASEALSILPETLKLSMAVQGDHNTISKLTAQTLFGFEMEMDRAAEVTDKFAFAIQKSLIEYEDLSSAVKFALPFFTSTGQSLDQLLGALAVLTNRALEAGIAGRGLRQAVAEFAESAMDAEVGFRKMGVEILNSEGEMKQLTEIAADFARVVGPETASNTELLTTLIQDLNVRGATAFIHLVQASDEFTEAVHGSVNAGGQLDEMVRIQNESLAAQIQILKNNVDMIFFFRDAAFEGTEFLNGFHKAVVEFVQTFKGLFVEELADGTSVLTDFGMELHNVAIDAVKELGIVMERLVEIIVEFSKEGLISAEMISLMVLPMKVFLEVLNAIGPDMLKFIIYFKMLNSVLPMTQLLLAGVARGATAAQLAMTGGALGVALLGGMMLLNATSRQSGGYVSPMAGGGMPMRDKPYLVGEQGPELFIPDRSGKILNTMQTQETIGSGKTVMKNVTIGIDSFGGLV